MANQNLVDAFKAENPDAYEAIAKEGALAARNSTLEEGAKTERERLTAVAGADVFTSKGFIAAFGDKGARWFCENKPFAEATAEYLAGVKTDHEAATKAKDDKLTEAVTAHTAAIAAKDAEIAELKTKLDAAPKGNDPASFSAEGGKAAPDQKLRQNLGENLARFAAGIKFVEPVATTLPAK